MNDASFITVTEDFSCNKFEMKEKELKILDKKTGKVYPTDYELIKEVNLGMEDEIESIVIAEYMPDCSWKFKTIPGSDIEILED